MSVQCEGALAAAAGGWAVHPCHVSFRADGKKIITRGSLPQRWETKPSELAEVIRRAFDAGANAYLIACGPSGLVVADLDVKAGVDGRSAWQGRPAGGLVVRTQSGGAHHYYRNDAAIGCPASGIRGVDIKGIGGGVFGPGSLDGAYQVLTSGALPPWSSVGLDLSRSTPRPAAQRSFFDGPDSISAQAAQRSITAELAKVTEHARAGAANPASWAGFRDTLELHAAYTLGGYVGSGFLDYDKAVWLLRQAITDGCGQIWPDSEASIERGLADGSARPLAVRSPMRPSRAGDAPVTAEPSTNLPDDFWAARRALRHIKAAAHSRGNGADGVLGVILARISSLVPGSLRVDTGVRIPAALNYYAILYGTRAVGKSSAAHQAEAMMPYFHDNDSVSHPIGSGQGIAAAYGAVNAEGQFAQTQFKAFFYAEEGSRLFKLARGAESTVIDVLKEAWTGKRFGQRNATAGLNRQVSDYSLGFWMGLQPTHAAKLFSDEAVDDGTLARFVWFAAADPSIPQHPEPMADALALPWDLACAWQCTRMEVAQSIQAELRRDNWLVATAQQQRALGSEHAPLLKIKTAGLLALLDHRHYIGEEDWQLAGVVTDTSEAIAASVRADMAQRAQRASVARTEAAATHAAVVAERVRNGAEASDTAKIEQMVARIPDLVKASPLITVGDLARKLRARGEGSVVRGRAAVELAAERGLIVFAESMITGGRPTGSRVRLP